MTTSAEGETFEWALYVPARRPPPRHGLYGYTCEFELPTGRRWQKLASDLWLKSDEDFNTFVRGAIAQYAADGKVPDEITPERVKALAAAGG